MKVLLSLKGEFKSATGKDWKPDAVKADSKPQTNVDELNNKIVVQGNKVRELKANKAGKVYQQPQISFRS